jgi:spore maturation protein A
MVNKIWAFLIIMGILFSIFTGRSEVINEEIIRSASVALDLILKIGPLIMLWTGIIKIAEKSGLLNLLGDKLRRPLKFLFPAIPEKHPALGYIATNIIVNLFGIGNASTPIGLKTMKSLQELNDKKDEATKSMITFLVLNTTGFTLVPTTVIALRMMHSSKDPTEIIIAGILASLTATISGLIIDKIIQRCQK